MWIAFAVTLTVFPAISSATDGKLTHFKLSNGLDVFVKEDHARKVAAVQLWVMVGSAYETDKGRLQKRSKKSAGKSTHTPVGTKRCFTS